MSLERCLLAVSIVAIGTVFIGAELEGPNVCKEIRNYTETVRSFFQEPYTVSEKVWCFKVPPTCWKNRTEWRVSSRIEQVVKQQETKKCCEGYEPSVAGDRCVPTCYLTKCPKRFCLLQDECKCELRSSSSCYNPSRCRPGKFGFNCEHNCTCKYSNGCSSTNGNCQCRLGWKGKKCDEPKCPLGKKGDNCEKDCTKGFFGLNCWNFCTGCPADLCNPVDGCASACSPGFRPLENTTDPSQFICFNENL